MAAGRGTAVALVGLSGTGKSTVAPLVAAALGWPSVDLDREVEAACGRRVADVFADEGEAAFRDLETAALRSALEGPPVVVATGGGVVLRAANRDLLARRCRVVWLRAAPDELAARLAGTDEVRPILAADPATTLRRLAGEREAAYAEAADHVVDVDDLTPDQVARAVLALLGDDPAARTD